MVVQSFTCLSYNILMILPQCCASVTKQICIVKCRFVAVSMLVLNCMNVLQSVWCGWSTQSYCLCIAHLYLVTRNNLSLI